MDFDDPIYLHSVWKVRFKTAILAKDKLDVALIGLDTACEIGRWMHAQGRQKFADRPSFQRAVAAHRKFHLCAGAVAEAINRRDYEQAERLIEAHGAYEVSSKEIVNALLELEADIGVDYAAFVKSTAQEAGRSPPP